jgi:hypothetical protein
VSDGAGGAATRRCHRSHAAIDGTGWVQEAADRAPLTELGQIFRMDLHLAAHPAGDYQTVNKFQVFDPPRAIGWMTGTEKGDRGIPFPPFGPDHLTNSLHHLAEVAAPAG